MIQAVSIFGPLELLVGASHGSKKDEIESSLGQTTAKRHYWMTGLLIVPTCNMVSKLGNCTTDLSHLGLVDPLLESGLFQWLR